MKGGEVCCVFFQAEDGIRDIGVTGVQTCALPIWPTTASGRTVDRSIDRVGGEHVGGPSSRGRAIGAAVHAATRTSADTRPTERRIFLVYTDSAMQVPSVGAVPALSVSARGAVEADGQARRRIARSQR